MAAGLAGCSGGGDPATPAEAAGEITINELQAANVLTSKDEAGAPSPWLACEVQT